MKQTREKSAPIENSFSLNLSSFSNYSSPSFFFLYHHHAKLYQNFQRFSFALYLFQHSYAIDIFHFSPPCSSVVVIDILFFLNSQEDSRNIELWVKFIKFIDITSINFQLSIWIFVHSASLTNGMLRIVDFSAFQHFLVSFRKNLKKEVTQSLFYFCLCIAIKMSNLVFMCSGNKKEFETMGRKLWEPRA